MGFIGGLSLLLIILIRLEGVHPADYHPEVIAGFGTAGVLIAVLTRNQIIPARLELFGYPLAVLATTAGVWAASPTFGPVIAMFYMWIGGTVVHVSRRYAIALITLVSVSYGALVLIQPGNPLPFNRLLLVTVFTVTFALLTNRMVARSWTLAEREHVARAESEQTRADLETVNEQKTRFLARMSHELRTPLNAVIGFSQVLASRSFGPLTDKQQEYAQDIVESGQHLLSLVDDLLDLSKVEAGDPDLSIGVVDVNQIVQSSVNMFEEQARRRQIDIAFTPRSGIGPITADARKLRQVVFNLLSNAVKFTPNGGHIVARVVATDQRLRFSISDTGPGIPAAERDAIFQEFHQADVVGSPARGGTGLGLPLARRFIELHGGRLWVDSTPAGATFVAEFLPGDSRTADDAAVPANIVHRLRSFGEPDSDDRRHETARIAAIAGVGVALAAFVTNVTMVLLPDRIPGAHPERVLFFVCGSVLLVALVALRPQPMASPRSLVAVMVAVLTALPFSWYSAGPRHRPVHRCALRHDRRHGAAGVLHRLVRRHDGDGGCRRRARPLGLYPGMTAPVARWAVTVGFIVATALILGRLVGVQLFATAERDAREEADRMAIRLLVATRHKTEFLANISHELRTPLNAVIGFSEVLQTETFGPVEREATRIRQGRARGGTTSTRADQRDPRSGQGRCRSYRTAAHAGRRGRHHR